MTTPAYCTSCGHALGVGRFCTNCGRPVPGRHPEAEPVADARPAPTVLTPPPVTPPITPPPVSAAPPAARYPLFAEVEPTVIRPVDQPPPPPHQPPGPGRPPGSGDRGSRTWLAWLAALMAVTLIAGLGAVLLLGGGQDTADDPTSGDSPGRGDTRGEGDDGEDGTDDGEDGADDGGPAAAPDPDDVIDVTSNVRASVPAVGAPSTDLAGRRVTFVAANMWDGNAATAWRMPGTGAGETIVFELGQDTVITEVGLINGYAKTDQGTDWYRGNRRIQQVAWEFDDGTRVTQDLRDQADMQTITVDPIRTGSVRLHLVRVSKPGGGPARRDNTAISEVRLLGAPVG